jgi:hypothetical protein
MEADTTICVGSFQIYQESRTYSYVLIEEYNTNMITIFVNN